MGAGKQARLMDIYVASPQAGATVYDFRARLEKSRGHRQARDLSQENVLLARFLVETQSEIARLRRLLAKS
jgi:hypothetical protein